MSDRKKPLENSTRLSGTRACLLSNGKTLTELEQISDRSLDCGSLESIIDKILTMTGLGEKCMNLELR